MESVNHQEIAISTSHQCWEHLEKGTRTAEEDRELLTLAFTSRYHWSFVDGEEHDITSSWLISRAAAAVGEGLLALNFAQLAYDLAHDRDAPEWLRASVHEGLARAYAAIGDATSRDEWCAAAAELADRMSDHEYRALIADHLDSVPRPAQ